MRFFCVDASGLPAIFTCRGKGGGKMRRPVVGDGAGEGKKRIEFP